MKPNSGCFPNFLLPTICELANTANILMNAQKKGSFRNVMAYYLLRLTNQQIDHSLVKIFTHNVHQQYERNRNHCRYQKNDK